jgi:hypothetical protein
MSCFSHNHSEISESDENQSIVPSNSHVDHENMLEINLETLHCKAYMYDKEDFRLYKGHCVHSHGSDEIVARIDEISTFL